MKKRTGLGIAAIAAAGISGLFGSKKIEAEPDVQKTPEHTAAPLIVESEQPAINLNDDEITPEEIALAMESAFNAGFSNVNNNLENSKQCEIAKQRSELDQMSGSPSITSMQLLKDRIGEDDFNLFLKHSHSNDIAAEIASLKLKEYADAYQKEDIYNENETIKQNLLTEDNSDRILNYLEKIDVKDPEMIEMVQQKFEDQSEFLHSIIAKNTHNLQQDAENYIAHIKSNNLGYVEKYIPHIKEEFGYVMDESMSLEAQGIIEYDFNTDVYAFTDHRKLTVSEDQLTGINLNACQEKEDDFDMEL